MAGYTINRKRLKAALEGVFEGPIGPVPRKPRQYGINHYVARTKPAVPEPSEDPIVLRPKEKPGAKRGYKVKRVHVVYTKPKKAKEPRPPKPRKVRGPMLKRVRHVAPVGPSAADVEREAKVYKPTPDEISRVTAVIQELKRSRLKAKPDTDPRSEECEKP
jgi:hypothetical protein